MAIVERYVIKGPVRVKKILKRQQQKKQVRRKKSNASANQQWFQRLIEMRIICGVRRKDKLRVFMRLCELSVQGFAKPNSEVSAEVKGNSGISAIEAAADKKAERARILRDVRSLSERKFLELYTRFDMDILRDIDNKFIDASDARTAINSALMDIVRAEDRRRPILTVITSVCGIKAKGMA